MTSKESRRLIWFCAILLLSFLNFVVAEEQRLEVHLSPSQITAPFIAGYGGTELVSIEIYNRSARPIEMPEKRWLVVERQDNPDSPIFTPLAPYTPLILDPGQKVRALWRLREPSDVQLASGAAGKTVNVAAGKHNIIIYYRSLGEEPWRKHSLAIELHKIPRGYIAMGIMIAVILFLWTLKSLTG